jgi:hypothetical protein
MTVGPHDPALVVTTRTRTLAEEVGLVEAVAVQQ